MPTIMSQNELFKCAIIYVTEQVSYGRKPLQNIIDEAAVRFNLGPKDTEYLEYTFLKGDEGCPG
ncbi:conserved hypothetical protein [Desulfovibrionales bacterium]